MRTIEFKLPKTLHNSDVFKQELRLDESEFWYGFNKEIYVANDKECFKIKKNTVFCFLLGEYQSLLTISLDNLPDGYGSNIFYKQDNICIGSPPSYYDISSYERIPQRINKGDRIIFKLFINFKDKKYIKFKKEPIIFINIFNQKLE